MSSSYLWGLPLSFSSVLLPPVPACSFLQLYWSIFLPSNPLYLLVPLLNLEPSLLSPLRAASPGFTLQVLFSLICHVIFLFSFPDLDSLGIVTLYSNNIIHKTFPTLWPLFSPLFGLRDPLSSTIIEDPKSFCSCGLYLPVFTELEFKTEKFLSIKLLKNTIISPLQVKSDIAFAFLTVFLMSGFIEYTGFSYLSPFSICGEIILWKILLYPCEGMKVSETNEILDYWGNSFYFVCTQGRSWELLGVPGLHFENHCFIITTSLFPL